MVRGAKRDPGAAEAEAAVPIDLEMTLDSEKKHVVAIVD